ncbi:autotransporter domain-containing protein [Brucella sp. BE17]|uniref:autotransporter domain-containing protein n=1 Tax=Brucella sp. BE17 TaxID=3142977 RepID=UPI0031BA7CD1
MNGELIIGELRGGILTIADGGSVRNEYAAISMGADGTVNVSGIGSTWRNNSNLYVGYTGRGTLNIVDGGSVESFFGTIGFSSESKGTVNVTGAGALWENTGGLTFGYFGHGTLTISDGGSVENSDGYLGHHPRSQGTVSVSGAGSTWNNNGNLFVGYEGTGTLTISDGGSVENSDGYLGRNPRSQGTVSVSGAGSTWNNTGTLFVGYEGTGTLTISDGGSVEASVGYIGDVSSPNGTVSVSGAGATWSNKGSLSVGHKGTGTLTISDGGSVEASVGYIGDVSDSNGTVSVSGAGATWNNTDTLFVGHYGTGTLTISDGGSVENSDGYLGRNPDSKGIVSVSGRGAKWNNTGTLFVGHYGTSTLTISNGGSVANSVGTIGNNPGSKGTVNVSGAGAIWKNTGSLTVGHHGTGTLIISDGGGVENSDGKIGFNPNSKSAVSVSGAGATWKNTGDLIVGESGSGSLDILDGASVENKGGIIAWAADVEGTVIVSGADATWKNTGNLTVGSDGTGTLTVANGGMVLAGNGGGGTVYLGYTGFGSGTLNIGTTMGEPAAAAGIVKAEDIVFGAGIAALTFNHSGITTFSTNLKSNAASTHIVNHIAGITTLTGDSSRFSGTTTVSGGKLLVGDASGNGVLGGAVNVAVDGTLGGGGALTGAVTVDGTLSAGNSPGTLTFRNDLTLKTGSTTVFEFNSPGVVGGSKNDLLVVNGALTLDGTLDAHVAAAGYYRLFDYDGTLSGSFADGKLTGIGGFAAVNPNNPDVRYDIPGQVNLSVMGANQTMQFWDGTGTTATGTADGGDGTWQSFATNWTDATGSANTGWGGSVGVFAGTAGTVNVQATQVFDTLHFSTDGYQIEGDGLAIGVAAGGSFNIDSGVTTSISSVIEDGAGNHVRKAGGGNLILSGNNTYTGGTHLLAGILSVASDQNLGAASGDLTFAGGTLATMSNFNSARLIDLHSEGGRFDVADATTLGLSGAITGDGNLIKQGEGTLVLTGTNAYGNTLVEAGKLTGSAGSISGDIANADTVVFDQAGDASFAGDISGLGMTDGHMIKDGGGRLILGGRSLLDWTVADGVLVTEAVRFGGDVGIDGIGAAFSFTDSGNAVYSGLISGTGNFSLDGVGTVLLTGDSSGFTGLTSINAGTLLVGDASGNGILGGSLDVRAGGTLGGAGAVGSGAGSVVRVASDGTLSPGNSIGTLTVDGDLVFEAGSHFVVEVNPQGGDSDLVSVAGNATLNGGAVAHIGANGAYDIRSTYTILSANGSLSGAFDDVTSDFAFLNPRLLYGYGAGTVALDLVRNDRDFASVASTRNQIATAIGIESIGFGAVHTVFDAIAQLPDDGDVIRASFDTLSGEIHASTKAALIEDSRFIRNAANERLRAAFGEAGASVTPVLAYGSGDTPVQVAADHGGPVFWSHGFASWGSTDGDDNAASKNRNTRGLLIGADTMVSDWRFGLLAGYSHSSFKVRDRSSSGSSENYHLGLYGATRWGNIALRTGAAYSWHDIDTSRGISIPGFTDNLSADYRGRTFQAFGELGYGMEMGDGLRFEPFANLAHVSLHTDGFHETGGEAALSGRSATTDVTFTTLGLRGEQAVKLGPMDTTFKGTIAWRHAYRDTPPESTHALSVGNAFTIAGVPIAGESAIIEAGLDLNLTPNATFGFSYAGQFAGSTRDHGVKANFNMRF